MSCNYRCCWSFDLFRAETRVADCGCSRHCPFLKHSVSVQLFVGYNFVFSAVAWQTDSSTSNSDPQTVWTGYSVHFLHRQQAPSAILFPSSSSKQALDFRCAHPGHDQSGLLCIWTAEDNRPLFGAAFILYSLCLIMWSSNKGSHFQFVFCFFFKQVTAFSWLLHCSYRHKSDGWKRSFEDLHTVTLFISGATHTHENTTHTVLKASKLHLSNGKFDKTWHEQVNWTQKNLLRQVYLFRMSYLSVRLTGITYTYNHLIELIDFGNDHNYLKQ